LGYNARNDEIRDNITRMGREWEAQRGALTTVRRFNATLSAKGYVWFWPKIAAALTSKHHWLLINCDNCLRCYGPAFGGAALYSDEEQTRQTSPVSDRTRRQSAVSGVASVDGSNLLPFYL
jgi:hypothetical protein